MHASLNVGYQGKSGPGKIHEVILVYFHSLMKSAFLPCKGLLCLYDKQNNTWLIVAMEFLFLCSTRRLTRELSS